MHGQKIIKFHATLSKFFTYQHTQYIQGIRQNLKFGWVAEARWAESRDRRPEVEVRLLGMEQQAPSPPTHFGSEKTLKVHVAGINEVSFNAQICIHNWSSGRSFPIAPPGYATDTLSNIKATLPTNRSLKFLSYIFQTFCYARANITTY